MKHIQPVFFAIICFVAVCCGNPSADSADIEFTDAVASALGSDAPVPFEAFQWTREPQAYSISGDTLRVTTAPHTDLWQRTYYHFRNDNAPVFQLQTREK